MKKKRKINKKRTFLFILILLSVIVLIILFFTKDKKSNLEKIGYSKLEIAEINKLTQSEIDKISKYKYNNNLIYMISSDKYNPNKLDLYLEYTTKYKNIDYNKIFNLINHKDFIESEIKEYISLLEKYDSIDNIIKYVNEYKDSDIKFSETTMNFINEKYFIEEYLDRYIEYYKNHNDLSYNEIVKRINCNLDKEFYVDTKPADTSKGMYTLVNKFYYLDKNYKSEDIVYIGTLYSSDTGRLNKTALDNFIKMAEAAKKEGLTLRITTAYRDYNFQSILYNNYVKEDGVKEADTYSARPGHSEHQLGYSADLTNGNSVPFDEFETTGEFKWLQNNAYKYGFILRFPKGKDYLTGYMYESWHYRYVGLDIAKYIYENDITYEEYYAYFLR